MIERRFSAAASTYDRHARPQRALARHVAELLPPDLRPDRLLELGAGTGQLTRLLAERYPDARIAATDLSETMVAHARERFREQTHVEWKVADARTHREKTSCPLVVSASALHWTGNLRATFANVARNLRPGGCFVVGLMLRGTLRELRELRAEIAPEKTRTDFLPSRETVLSALAGAGFRIEEQRYAETRFAYPDASALLRALHEQGVTGGEIAPLTRGELERLVKTYQRRFAAENGVFATYETLALRTIAEESVREAT